MCGQESVVGTLRNILSRDGEADISFIEWIAAGESTGRTYKMDLVFELYNCWQVAYEQGQMAAVHKKTMPTWDKMNAFRSRLRYAIRNDGNAKALAQVVTQSQQMELDDAIEHAFWAFSQPGARETLMQLRDLRIEMAGGDIEDTGG